MTLETAVIRYAIVCHCLFILNLVATDFNLLAQTLTKEEFERLHKQLEPGIEKWKTVDWYPDLIRGQKAAIDQSKPMFIWAMDGHPLGCT